VSEVLHGTRCACRIWLAQYAGDKGIKKCPKHKRLSDDRIVAMLTRPR
jgi:hypothetical protein